VLKLWLHDENGDKTAKTVLELFYRIAVVTVLAGQNSYDMLPAIF